MGIFSSKHALWKWNRVNVPLQRLENSEHAKADDDSRRALGKALGKTNSLNTVSDSRNM